MIAPLTAPSYDARMKRIHQTELRTAHGGLLGAILLLSRP